MFEVDSVAAGSPAERAGIIKGDKIISINSQKLIDYVDYVYFCAIDELRVKLIREDKTITVNVDNNEGEDLGLEFTTSLMGRKRVCGNKCIFCFVDQLPRGMRKSLYLKDEDWRYSLIMGNYVTMSTISKDELRRIIKRKASPLFISVHTVDEDLRKYLLGNDKAVKIRPLLKKLKKNGIKFHAQVVVCPGVNDGEKLNESIEFLSKLYPACRSLAVVPVGLSSYRDGLKQISPITETMARQTILMVESWQQQCLNRVGTRFVFASDEYYIKAKMQLPEYESYEAFDQIENGVGMVAKFLYECGDAQELVTKKHVSIATGVDSYPFFADIAAKARGQIDVYAIKNFTFGNSVTVSGLLGGGDYIKALEGKKLGDKLLITADCLRDGEVFLDDVKLSELEEKLGVPIVPIRDGYHFANVINETEED